jgi:hypothetical protein
MPNSFSSLLSLGCLGLSSSSVSSPSSYEGFFHLDFPYHHLSLGDDLATALTGWGGYFY